VKSNYTGISHELLRKVVGWWPFERGTQRIPAELGKAFPAANAKGVIGRVGRGDVRFPYQPGDLAHPGYWFLYEKGVRRTISEALRPGSVYIDIGAHRGWHVGYALALVNPGGCVIACEPHPQHAACLRQLASLNSDKDLRIHETAVAKHVGEATLLASVEEGWHTIVPEFNELCNVPRKPIQVKTISLDELIAQHDDLKLHVGSPRVVIKIDAEGSELDILRGGTKTLRLLTLRTLVMECTGGPSPFRERARDCIQLLRDAGLEVVVITHSGCRRWHDSDADAQVNILASRR
jgi:FkbM family methyltransferase